MLRRTQHDTSLPWRTNHYMAAVVYQNPRCLCDAGVPTRNNELRSALLGTPPSNGPEAK